MQRIIGVVRNEETLIEDIEKFDMCYEYLWNPNFLSMEVICLSEKDAKLIKEKFTEKLENYFKKKQNIYTYHLDYLDKNNEDKSRYLQWICFGEK